MQLTKPFLEVLMPSPLTMSIKLWKKAKVSLRTKKLRRLRRFSKELTAP